MKAYPMRFLLTTVLLFFLPWRLPAADEGPVFVLNTAGGSTPTGPLSRLDADWSVQLAGPESGRIAGAEVVSLRQSGSSLPRYPVGEQVLFANGDRLQGTFELLADEQVRFSPGFDLPRKLNLPLAGLSVLWLQAPEGADSPELLRRRLLAEKRTRDILFLVNGDVLEGTLTALDAKSVVVEADSKEVSVQRAKVAVIALNTELVRAPQLPGVSGRLVLADGDRLTLRSARGDAKTWTGVTAFGEEIQVPVGRVVALDVLQNRAVYLSDLKPKRYEHTPYFDVAWPFVTDGSVAGRDLRLGGSTYDKGLGLHSESRLTYALNGGYRRFESVVGLDEQTGRRGRVRIQVLVDGRPQALGWDKELTLADGPRAVRVDLTGARELTLVVAFRDGGRGPDAQDHVNWGDARLIR
jgi:hypothetical protein